MSGKTVQLPGRDEMIGRLLNLSSDMRLQETLYEDLLGFADRQFTASGVAGMLADRIETHVENLHPTQILTFAFDLLDALVGEDDVAAEAKAMLEEELAKFDKEIVVKEYGYRLALGRPIETHQPHLFFRIVRRCRHCLSRWWRTWSVHA